MSSVLSALRHLDLWTILVSAADIVIVYFIIYRVLLLFRRTRAAYTLIGLLVVAVIFLGAHQLQLTTLSWLLDNVINYIILIVIIVFQADIRRGLMRVGRRMFSPASGHDNTSIIEEVVKACEVMAEKRIGALIVFERDVDLAELIEPGTTLDAAVSQALLYNIFNPWPDNPLHDGAILIKDEQVHQAGVVLPLSQNPGLDKVLGTRHRAGLGITEETDAIAIVVSEQRGSISLCTGGLLHMGLPPQVLRAELLARLTPETRSKWRYLKRLMGLFVSRLEAGQQIPVRERPRRTGPHVAVSRPPDEETDKTPVAEERTPKAEQSSP